MVKRTGGLKGCKHYESKVVAHYKNGGEVGGVAGGSSVNGSGNRGNGGFSNSVSQGGSSGGGMGGGNKGGVNGTGVTTGKVTGSRARNPDGDYGYVMGEPVRRVQREKVVAQPVRRAAVPVGMAPPAKPIGRITSITGGYEIQGYGPTTGAVPAQFKQYYDRIPGNLPTAVTGGHGSFGYGGGRFAKGGSVKGPKK
ncbi:MAG: hypothetical protein ACR2JS_08920 [Candidatus Nanopelagicales bacterium]